MGPNPTLLQNIQRFSKFGPVVKSAGHAILGSMFLPGMICFFIWQLSPTYDLATVQGSLVRSAWYAMPFFFFGLVLTRILRAGGTAESQMGWSPILCDGLLKTISKLVWVCLPLKVFYSALETFEGGAYYESLGRFAFIIGFAVLGLGLWQTAQAIHKWSKPADYEVGWACGIQRCFLGLVAICPFGLAIMAAAGYHFSAVQLSWRFVVTVVLCIGIAVIAGLISRLLLITQFRIKLRQLNRNSDGEIHEDESIDISEISQQVNRLLRITALVSLAMIGWQIWGNVFPAIGYLDQFQLWESALAKPGEVEWITLRHLLVALAALFFTYVLSRNLPGLLEITLLDRLPLDRGGRYAISFVMRYVVGIIGTLTAFRLIGFSWSSVQYLAAGLTVGLGFGLQEIFANLVSGIIILIERPVRVGDMVTVNGVTGTVTQMQLRATTIKDLDYRELIVPNKKFITEDVMNWTLSDRLSRLSFPVGIAYGSDTELAERTLMKVAREHRLVLNDPKPTVLFKSFGDSTLDFELRVVIPRREQFADIQHEINMAIDAAFREANIEIAFPQQDVNVKGLEQSLMGDPPPKPGKAVEPVKLKTSKAITGRKDLGPEDFTGMAFAELPAEEQAKATKIPEVSFAPKKSA